MCSIEVKKIFVVVAVLCEILVASGRPTEDDSVTSPIIENDIDEQNFEPTSLCGSKKLFLNPDDLIESTNELWDFDRNFSQTIEVELCENEGAPCSDYPTVKTKCRQKYLSIQLQVVSKNSTLSELRTFKIPSFCECTYFKSNI